MVMIRLLYINRLFAHCRLMALYGHFMVGVHHCDVALIMEFLHGVFCHSLYRKSAFQLGKASLKCRFPITRDNELAL